MVIPRSNFCYLKIFLISVALIILNPDVFIVNTYKSRGVFDKLTEQNQKNDRSQILFIRNARIVTRTEPEQVLLKVAPQA